LNASSFTLASFTPPSLPRLLVAKRGTVAAHKQHVWASSRRHARVCQRAMHRLQRLFPQRSLERPRLTSRGDKGGESLFCARKHSHRAPLTIAGSA
jgi:hypothetical protein